MLKNGNPALGKILMDAVVPLTAQEIFNMCMDGRFELLQYTARRNMRLQALVGLHQTMCQEAIESEKYVFSKELF